MSSDKDRSTVGAARGAAFVVSAPSGAGKTTLCNMAVDFFPNLRHSISYTTRSPRPGETDGVEYHFVDDGTFTRMADSGEFLEYAGVYGKRYGTSKADLERLLDGGADVLIEIDVQGAAQLRKALPGGVYVFIIPPSVEACRARLIERGKDPANEIEMRVAISVEEIKKAPDYDYIIINDELERAFEDFKSVITAEMLKKDRVMPRVAELFGL